MWIAIAVDLRDRRRFRATSCSKTHPGIVAFVLAFAAGAILTMLADTMMPEAYQHGGKWVGIATTLGFAVAFTIHVLNETTNDEASTSTRVAETDGGSRIATRSEGGWIMTLEQPNIVFILNIKTGEEFEGYAPS